VRDPRSGKFEGAFIIQKAAPGKTAAVGQSEGYGSLSAASLEKLLVKVNTTLCLP
jgi:hypothetical protein